MYQVNTSHWSAVTGAIQADKVFVGGPQGQHKWAIRSDNSVWYSIGGMNNWQPVTGRCTWLGVGRMGSVYAIDHNGSLFKWNGQRFHQAVFSNQPCLRKIAVASSNQIVGLDLSDNIYRLQGSQWVKLPGLCRDISIGVDGTMWCCNRTMEIYRWTPSKNNWTKKPGLCLQVSVGDANHVMCRNQANEVYAWNERKGNWDKQSNLSDAGHISVTHEGILYGAKTSGVMMCGSLTPGNRHGGHGHGHGHSHGGKPGQCTFLKTGFDFKHQSWYNCITCGIVGNSGICQGCADTEHMGHQLGPRRTSNFFCDCAAAGTCNRCYNTAIVSSTKNGQCTFKATGTVGTRQLMYHCHTCSLTGNLGCCSVCAKTCHAGHALSKPKLSQNFYCDCSVYGKCMQAGPVYPGGNPVPGYPGSHMQPPPRPMQPNPMPSYPMYPQVNPMPVPCQVPSAVAYPSGCPKCHGKGGMGTFGPCSRGDIHYKRPCPTCDGNGATTLTQICIKCNGQGGMGTFGPCEIKSVHFKRNCELCQGRCYFLPGTYHVKCTICNGMGGRGTFGPCSVGDVHYKGRCQSCRGIGK